MDGNGPAGESPAIGLTRDYKRLPAVEAEIAALAEVADTGLRAAAAAAKAPETLVHAIRRLKRAGDERGARELAGLLVERAQALVARAAAGQFPSSPDDRADVVQMASVQLWQEVLDTSPGQEFWEVHFHRMVVLACSDAADAIRKQRERERQFDRGEDDEGEPFDEEANVPDPEPMDTDLFVPEALGRLEGDVRRAAYLRTLGYKERSKNPNEPTIAKLLGVSDRTVRTYLGQAKEILGPWRAAGDAQADRGRSSDAGRRTSNELEGSAP
jgi:DNA-directed RNA polymerase specialized sigma24 family protein